MATKISSFLEEKHIALEAEVFNAKDKKRAMKAKVAALTKELNELRIAIAEEKAFLKQAQSKSLETSSLVGKIQEMTNELTEKSAQIDDVKKEIGLLVVPKLDDKKIDRERRLSDILKILKMPKAIEIETIDDAIPQIKVHDIVGDSSGRPYQCSLTLGTLKKEINFKPCDGHYLMSFRPELLSWLPSIPEGSEVEADLESDSDSEESCEVVDAEIFVFIERRSQRIVLPNASLRWRTMNPAFDRYYGKSSESPSEFIDVEDNFEDVALSLSTRIDELLKKEDGALDLSKNYDGNVLGTCVKSQIVLKTTPNPLFKPCNDRPDSDTIYKQIKEDWNAFIDAPWTEEISGILARLKYYLENRERARFWAWGFENFYGFRLRTRDHDWIKGKIYIDRHQESAPKNSQILLLNQKYSHQVGKIGRMYLEVESQSTKD